MTSYEVVGYEGKMPSFGSADNLADAKKIRDEFLATGRYYEVFIRQYRKDKWGHETFRVLHSHTKTATPTQEPPNEQ